MNNKNIFILFNIKIMILVNETMGYFYRNDFFFYPYALYAVFINDINLHLRQYFTIKRSINKFTRTRKYPNESD